MRFTRVLVRGYEAPLWMHYGAYVLVGVFVWVALFAAGVSGPVALAIGIGTGTLAEVLAEAAWRRRERRKPPSAPSRASVLGTKDTTRP